MKYIFLTIFFLSSTIFTRPSLKEKLYTDIEDQYLDDFSRIEAAFILSGIENRDSLSYYLNWYNVLVEKIKRFPYDPLDKIGYAQKIFIYIHSTWLKKYEKEATTLCDIIKKKHYNCVAATILYNLICDDVNLTTRAFETPTHVYTIFNDLDKNIIVENTSSMGFNMLKNLKSYSKYLASFYPKSQVLKIGLDRLYAHENSKGREINNTELLGLLAYNQAYFAMKEKAYENAYQLVFLAQLFNTDSRSNIEFEIGLYYHWGNQLYKSGSFDKAFEVFADGFYRYPDNGDFRQNTRASFFKIMYVYWQKKEWPKCKIIIDEMLELDILTDRDMMNFRSILKNWILYFIQKKNKAKANECLKYYKHLFDSDKDEASYKKMIDTL